MIAFAIVLLVLVSTVQYFSLKNVLKGISYRSSGSKLLVEPDEDFEIVTTITNTSSRFVPYLGLDEPLPGNAKVLCDKTKTRVDVYGDLRYSSTVYLLKKSHLERRLPISLPERGQYFFKSAYIKTGDFLGIVQDRKNFYSLNSVVVYPKAARVEDVTGILGGFIGDISVRRFIMEDPVLTVGARDYTGSEPLKQISWSHSARTNRLMVKQFDYTAEPTATVMLDVNSTCEAEEKERRLESCFSIARTVCEMLEARGIQYDFITNASTGNALFKWSYIAEGLGRGHFLAILEGLGRASYFPTETFAETIEKIHAKRNMNRSTILIMPERDPTKEKMAEKLQEQGGARVAFLYGEEI